MYRIKNNLEEYHLPRSEYKLTRCIAINIFNILILIFFLIQCEIFDVTLVIMTKLVHYKDLFLVIDNQIIIASTFNYYLLHQSTNSYSAVWIDTYSKHSIRHNIISVDGQFEIWMGSTSLE